MRSRKRPNHGPAPIPQEGCWTKVKEVTDVFGLTHGVGWCAPQCDLLKPYSANLAQVSRDRLGIVLADAALDRAGDEAVALRRHLLAVLLAHGAARDVGLAETVAGEVARDLLHLFLIGDDAVGRLQDRLQFWMQIVGTLMAELARAIGRNIRHRAGTIERHQHDQVLETVRPHVDQRAPHALTFNLEHADGFAARQHLVGLGVVERQVRQIDIDAAAFDEFYGEFDTLLSVFRPRKSNFTRPAGSTHFMSNWVTGMFDFGSR